MIFYCNPGPLPEFALHLLTTSSQQAINFDGSFSLTFYTQTITSNLRYKNSWIVLFLSFVKATTQS